MDWPTRKPSELDASEKKSVAKGIFRKCNGCGLTLPAEAFYATFEVCPDCGQHHKLSAPRWRDLLLDATPEGTLEEWDEHLTPADPLHDPHDQRAMSIGRHWIDDETKRAPWGLAGPRGRRAPRHDVTPAGRTARR